MARRDIQPSLYIKVVVARPQQILISFRMSRALNDAGSFKLMQVRPPTTGQNWLQRLESARRNNIDRRSPNHRRD